MKYIFIFLLGLITFQVTAQTKIIGASQFITSARLADSTEAVRFDFKRDTAFKTTTGQTFLVEDIAHLERYNNIKISMKGTTADPTVLWFPSASNYYSQVVYRVFAQSDSVNLFFPSGGYYVGNNGVRSYHRMELGETSQITAVKDTADMWRWAITSSMDTLLTGGGSAPTITLSGAVTGTGTTSIVTTLSNNVVTTAKILDGTIALADLGSNSVNSSKIVDASVALGDMAANSVDNTKVVDYSLTGTDLNYLTLRAGDVSNAVLRFTNGIDKSSPLAGEWMPTATRLGYVIGTTIKRVALTNDVTPSAGQLPIGNGTDYTAATLTAGYAQTVTNGSGSITILPDTTKVIPYIPEAEIGNGTRDGYYKTQTDFGNQFYNGLYIKEDQTTLSSNGDGSLNIRRLDASGSAYINYGIESGLKPYVLAQVTEIDTPTNNKSFKLTQKGFESQAYNSTPSINEQVASYAITGEYSVEHIDDVAVTSITLPEIVNEERPITGKVAPGFILYLSVNRAAGITISRAGSDTILQNGVIGSVTSLSTTGGTTYSRILIAVKPDVWMVY